MSNLTSDKIIAIAEPLVHNKDINPLANSKFWLPMKSIGYFLSHSQLWSVVMLPLCCALVINLVLVIVLLAAAFPAQAILFQQIDKLRLEYLWATWLIAFVLTLLEILLSLLITIAVCFGHFEEVLFKKTMEIEGVSMREGTCSENCASDFWMGFFRFAILLITLPLHFIPVLGTIAFCYINGLLQTWSLKMPYFHAFNISWQKQWNEYVSPNKSDYYSFGFSAMLLSCIPVVNFLFCFTNNIGAAIWCANEHKARSAMTSSNATEQQQQPSTPQDDASQQTK